MPHHVLAFSCQDFMGFEDSGWIAFSPITLLYGRNSSGKSALIRALLLLRQSNTLGGDQEPLAFVADSGLDLGSYYDLVRSHDIKRDIGFGLRVQVVKVREPLFSDGGVRVGTNIITWKNETGWLYRRGVVSDYVDLFLRYGLEDNRVVMKSLKIRAEVDTWRGDDELDQSKVIDVFGAYWNVGRWEFDHGFFDEDDNNAGLENPWVGARLVRSKGLVPSLQTEDQTKKGNWESKSYSGIQQLLDYLSEETRLLFDSISYLGPIRSEPQRFYHVPHLSRISVGMRGENMVRAYLVGRRNRLSTIADSLPDLGWRYRLELKPLAEREAIYAVLLIDPERDSDSPSRMGDNLREVGFGVSQSLPVLLETLLAEPETLIIVEQPELHLHPEAQVALADFFIDQVGAGKRFLLETHSENFLLRFQRRIAETTFRGKSMATLADRGAHDLQADALAVIYVGRENGLCRARQIQADRYGQLYVDEAGRRTEPPLGFLDFFRFDFEDVDTMDRVVAALMEMEAEEESINRDAPSG